MAIERNKFQQLIEHLPEVVWLLDTDLEEALYTNPAYEKLLQRLAPETDWPLDRDKLAHPADSSAAREWFETIREDIRTESWEAEYPFEARVTGPDGEVYWLETIGVPIIEDGEVIGLVGLSSDVTERVRREAALEEQVSQLDQFVSMVTHDIRNPLTVAKTNLELYGETGESDHLENLRTALERIDELTTDLVALAREGMAETETTRTHLDVVATRAWEAIDTQAATLETEPVGIDADSSKLQTMFENLFRNAVGHGGGDVTVRVRSLADGFFVEDTGVGISDDLREQVMEHGFSTGYSGTGIGLTIVQRIADAHGWDIEVGDSPEGGARFVFRVRGPSSE